MQKITVWASTSSGWDPGPSALTRVGGGPPHPAHAGQLCSRPARHRAPLKQPAPRSGSAPQAWTPAAAGARPLRGTRAPSPSRQHAAPVNRAASSPVGSANCVRVQGAPYSPSGEERSQRVGGSLGVPRNVPGATAAAHCPLLRPRCTWPPGSTPFPTHIPHCPPPSPACQTVGS